MIQKYKNDESPRLLLTTEYSAIWLVIVIGFTLSLAALWLIRGQLESHKDIEFEWVVHNRVRAINHGIDNGLLAITNIGDFFEASEFVDPDRFKQFAASQLEKHEEIHALMWVPESVLHADTEQTKVNASGRPENGGWITRRILLF